ncbi:MAG: thioesterase [Rhodobacterales bacterium]|nr:MAG: thioesterase [Rhodobacterales bacterium]
MDTDTANAWLTGNFADWVLALEPEVVRAGCTGVALSIPVRSAITQPGGHVAGPALTTLAETAMILACARHLRAFRPMNRVSLDMQFFRPAQGERIGCAATVEQADKALIFTRAVLTAEPSSRDVAAATAAFALG